MSKKWYGSVDNRIEEGKNYTKRELKVGDDITIYLWSDRHCAYITKVIDQKHIFVKDYCICADHSKNPQTGHQDWLYFKTQKEKNAYLNSVFPKSKYEENPKENKEQEWMFRYGHWNTVCRFTQKTIDEIKEREGWCRLYPTNDKEKQLLAEGKEVVRYTKITEGISFGVRNYYYDWEF